MIYSVWNQSRQQFDYWEDAREQLTLNVEKPDHIQERALGSTAEQAAWPLPSDAKLTGSGMVPIGRIAAHPAGAGGALGDFEPSATKIGVLALAAVAAWQIFRKPRSRR